jgi:hypothetical protein
MAKIVLDLQDIFKKGFMIDEELKRVITEAIEKKIALVEIIPGKGSAIEEAGHTIPAPAGSKKTPSSTGKGRQEFRKDFYSFQSLDY